MSTTRAAVHARTTVSTRPKQTFHTNKSCIHLCEEICLITLSPNLSDFRCFFRASTRVPVRYMCRQKSIITEDLATMYRKILLNGDEYIVILSFHFFY